MGMIKYIYGSSTVQEFPMLWHDFVLSFKFGCATMKLNWLGTAAQICPYPGYNTTVVTGHFEAVHKTLSLILHPRLEAC